MADFPSNLKPSVTGGYSFARGGSNISRVALAGGRSLAMRQYSTPNYIAQISLIADRTGKAQFEAFYKSEANKGGKLFSIDIDIGEGLKSYDVKMVRGSVSYSGSDDPVWRIAFSVSVVGEKLTADAFILSKRPTAYFAPMYGYGGYNQGSEDVGNIDTAGFIQNIDGRDTFGNDGLSGRVSDSSAPTKDVIPMDKVPGVTSICLFKIDSKPNPVGAQISTVIRVNQNGGQMEGISHYSSTEIRKTGLSAYVGSILDDYTLTYGVWVCEISTYKSTISKFFIDGVIFDTGTFTPIVFPVYPNGHVKILQNMGSSSTIDGNVALTAWLPVALSDAEVADLSALLLADINP